MVAAANQSGSWLGTCHNSRLVGLHKKIRHLCLPSFLTTSHVFLILAAWETRSTSGDLNEVTHLFNQTPTAVKGAKALLLCSGGSGRLGTDHWRINRCGG